MYLLSFRSRYSWFAIGVFLASLNHGCRGDIAEEGKAVHAAAAREVQDLAKPDIIDRHVVIHDQGVAEAEAGPGACRHFGVFYRNRQLLHSTVSCFKCSGQSTSTTRVWCGDIDDSSLVWRHRRLESGESTSTTRVWCGDVDDSNLVWRRRRLESGMALLWSSAVPDCVAEVVLSQQWTAVTVTAGSVLPRWILGSLLLALSRRGVFTSVATTEAVVDEPAAGGVTGMVLLASSLASVDNRRGRPLLVLALDGVTAEHVHRHVHGLAGALVYDVPSGAVYRAARYADVGPLVRHVGSCGSLDAAIREATPLGWQDLRVVNRTYNILQGDSYRTDIDSTPFSLLYSIQHEVRYLKEAMHFKDNDLKLTNIDFVDALALFKNGTIDFMVDGFADSGDRREYLSFPHVAYELTSRLFIGTPPLVTESDLGGAFSTDVGVALLGGVALLLLLAGRLLLGRPEQGPLTNCLQISRLFCNQGLEAVPGRPCQYVAGAVLCLAAMLVSQFYTAGLLSRITTERRHLPFVQPENVLLRPDWQSTFTTGYADDDYLRYRYGQRPDFARAIDAVTKQPYSQEPMRAWIKRAERGQFGFFRSGTNWPEQCSRERCPNLCWHPTPLFSSHNTIPFRRGLPEEDAWRLALMRMRETGIWSALRRRQVPVLPGSPIAACDLEPQPREHISGLPLGSCLQAFTVLLCGAVAAAGLLLCELLLARLTRENKHLTRVT